MCFPKMNISIAQHVTQNLTKPTRISHIKFYKYLLVSLKSTSIVHRDFYHISLASDLKMKDKKVDGDLVIMLIPQHKIDGMMPGDARIAGSASRSSLSVATRREIPTLKNKIAFEKIRGGYIHC